VTEASMNEMRQIRFDKLDALIEAGKDPHQIEHFRDRQYSEDIKADYADWEEKTVRVAGRILSRRGHGKVSFVHILDAKGQIQLFLKADVLGDGYEEAKHLDIGDIVGAEGEVFTTKTGEISVRVKEITLLTKSLTILPEKFHGLKDIDLRYRQRYVDLIINPEVRDTFRLRTRIISEIRRYLDDKGFLEVETPILNTIAGGATARPFVTHHNTLDIDMYLRIANELYLKRLIVGGFDKVINNDESIKGKIKVVFVTNYRVSYGEKLFPAADISEQISTAGKEASGTGNMKFMLNATPTIGTMDGANVEIVEEAGAENNFIFGATVEEIREKRGSYDPVSIYNNQPDVKRVVDSLVGDELNDAGSYMFLDIYNSLVKPNNGESPDQYFVLHDFASYKEAQKEVDKAYRDRQAWAKKCLINMANAGKFSSDRTIKEYAEEIWGIEPAEIEVNQ
jgi:hypothetical protein